MPSQWNLKIEAFKYEGGEFKNISSDNTLEDGSYAVRNLSAGDYALKLSDPGSVDADDTHRPPGYYLTKYYGATSSYDSLDLTIPDLITVPESGSIERDISPDTAAAIGGVVS